MTRAEISGQLLRFISESFLDNDLKHELDETTPLLDWGILNSLNMTLLLNFIRVELGCLVPPADINAQNFQSVSNITSMILGLAVAAPSD